MHEYLIPFSVHSNKNELKYFFFKYQFFVNIVSMISSVLYYDILSLKKFCKIFNEKRKNICLKMPNNIGTLASSPLSIYYYYFIILQTYFKNLYYY